MPLSVSAGCRLLPPAGGQMLMLHSCTALLAGKTVAGFPPTQTVTTFYGEQDFGSLGDEFVGHFPSSLRVFSPVLIGPLRPGWGGDLYTHHSGDPSARRVGAWQVTLTAPPVTVASSNMCVTPLIRTPSFVPERRPPSLARRTRTVTPAEPTAHGRASLDWMTGWLLFLAH